MSHHPSIERVWAAFILAPILPCISYFSIFSGTYELKALFLALLALPVCYFLMLVLAMPSYFILKANKKLKPHYIILLAAFIAIIPEIIMELSPKSPTSNFYAHQCQIIFKGERTLCGYQVLAIRLLKMFSHGLIAGIIFCTIYFNRLTFWKPSLEESKETS